MAQNQQITPDTLPANFGQWDSSPDTLPANFSGFDADKSAPETKSSALMRFLKGGASSYLNATLNAGPTSAAAPVTDQPYNPPKTNTEALKRMWSTITGGVKAIPDIDPVEGVKDLASQFNPIDVQKFQSGDTAGGMGSSLMNLLLLRKAFKGGAPEYGRPAQGSEIVQPLSGYPKSQPASTATAAPAPVSATPSNSTLPNATYLQPEMRSLLRPKASPPPSEISKDVNTNVQDYFIQKMREQMNRQTVTGSAEQEASAQRMAEYAKTPVDKMQGTASGPVPSGEQFAYRMRDAGETGIMPNPGKTAQASVDPAKVQSYEPGRAQAQNHAQEMVRVDLSKLDPSEYSIQPNGYVKFHGPVPESFIEKMGSKATDDLQPRVPTSDADLQDLLMKSIQRVQSKAKAKTAGQ